MKASDIELSVREQFAITNKIVFAILGKPGGGKSAVARKILRDLGFKLDKDVTDLSEATAFEFTGSTRDPVDTLGTPTNLDRPFTKWIPPEVFYYCRRGVGRRALLLEEFTDSSVAMQNALCQVIYDGRNGENILTDELFILCTGNRTEDKSGANRLTSKLANRVRFLNFTEDLDDWVRWALEAGVDPVVIAFLRFKPDLLSAFDPAQLANPTPRSWERVSFIPTTLPGAVYLENVMGEVGEAPAAQYVAFRRLFDSLPDLEKVLANPSTYEVPAANDVRYALSGALAHCATKDNFDRVVTYANRMPKEFSIITVNDAIKKRPELRSTKAFVTWAQANADVMLY
jgi:hypothetical protein